MASVTNTTSTIDVPTLVSQLMAVERQPATLMQKQLAGVQTQISALGSLQGKMSALQDAARKLDLPQTWGVASASSSDANVLTASASAGALGGAHSLVVNRLAQRQTLNTTQTWASASTVFGDGSGGTLTIEMGAVSAGSFQADSARPATAITIPAGATLAEVRDAVNAAKAGVSASLLTDATGVRLVMSADDTGASNAFRVSGSGDPALSDLAFDPAAGSTTRVTVSQAAQNASVTLDGVAVSATTNHLEGVLENISFDLKSTGSATVTVSADATAMQASIQSFVSAWNDLNSTLATQTKYDSTTKKAGALQGDTAILSMQRQMRAILGGNVSGSTLQNLSSAGIAIQRDGSLSVDNGKLSTALTNPSKLQTLFAAAAGATTGNGIARQLDTALGSFLGTGGALTAETTALNRQVSAINDKMSSFETRMAAVQARLTAQYTGLNATLQKFGTTSSFLSSKFSG